MKIGHVGYNKKSNNFIFTAKIVIRFASMVY